MPYSSSLCSGAVQVSPPLVAFRETVACPEEGEGGAQPSGPSGTTAYRVARVVEAVTPSGAVVRALCLFCCMGSET